MNEPLVRLSLHIADEEVESLEVNPLRLISAKYPWHLEQIATRLQAWQRRAGIPTINMFGVDAVCTVLQNADRTCRVDYIDDKGQVVALQAQMVDTSNRAGVHKATAKAEPLVKEKQDD